MVVQLSILVGNADDLIGLGYTHIEVHQSIDQGNSYQEITSPAATAAVLSSSPANTLFQMGGKLLKLKVDGGDEQSISFNTIISLWTPTQVANRINEVIPSLASVDGQKVVLTSPIVDRASSIEITYNDATDLGLALGQIVFGTSGRIPFINDVFIYTFPDVAGKEDDRYKWRFSANGASPISGFSTVVSGQLAPALDPSLLSVAVAKFYDVVGQPVKTRLLVAVDSLPQSLSAISGGFISKGQAVLVDSDDSGFWQTPMVRGAKVRIGIEGTAYVREFVVPDAPSFNLLDVMATATDPFTVQTVPPLLIRRSI